MSNSAMRGSALMFAVIVLANLVDAQVPALGTPPFSSIAGGPVDSLNLGNLNSHFSVPVVHKAGRGIPFNYDLNYDTSIYQIVPNGASNKWLPITKAGGVISYWGWQDLGPVFSPYVGYSYTTQTLPCGMNNQASYTVYSYSNFVYYDPSTTSHLLGASGSYYDSSNCNGFGPPPGPQPPGVEVATARDGSGYTANVSFNLGSATGNIVSRSGSIVAAPYLTSPPASSSPYSMTDANGNVISVSNAIYTDTLGKTALTVTGGAPNPVKFTYTGPTGSQFYQVNFTSYNVKTNFGCSQVPTEYTENNVSLVSSILLPDGSQYTFTYESTPGNTGFTTGRISQVTVPGGGTISYDYTYTGTNDGINCTDGSNMVLKRTVSPGGIWQYSRSGTSPAWTTLVTDPAGNQTSINFEQYNGNLYETQRLVYQGTTAGTLLSTTINCYNGQSVTTPANCYNTAIAAQVTRVTNFRYFPNSSGVQAETDSTYDNFGLIHEVDEYDYGVGVVGSLLRKTITAYTTLGNGIVDRPSSVTVKDIGNNTVAYTSYGYDETTPATPSGTTPQHVTITGSRGLLTSVKAQANGTTYLYRKYAYYNTGTLSTSTDVSTSSTTNGATTTYNYNNTGTPSPSCGNSFVTSITEPLSLSRSMTWDCNGGVMLSLTDENGNTSSTAYSGANYTNYFWRPYSTTDQNGTITDYLYILSASKPFQEESKYDSTFNGGNSTIDTLTTIDGFGRTIFQQTKQSPTSQNYDTVATCYDNLGNVNLSTLPYSHAAITSSTAACPSTNAGTTYTYDALSRTSAVSDSGGGSTAYAYNENDVLQTLTSPLRRSSLNTTP